jgi:hypothetical protein
MAHGRLYSATIKNSARSQVVVECTYVPINGTEKEILTQRIDSGKSKSFAPKKSTSGFTMYVESFVVTDENKEETFRGPFVEQDKDKKNFVIEESEDSRQFVFSV